MKSESLESLNDTFKKDQEASKEAYAEMRSNVLLVSGRHYSNVNSSYWSRLKRNKSVESERKIRITNNYTQKITKEYVNSILNKAPGTRVFPNNEKELQDQKQAELNQSVWGYAKDKLKLRNLFRRSCKDFVEIGECAVKIFFDPDKGDFLGYEEISYQDAEGNVGHVEHKPVFNGEVSVERIMPWDISFAASAKSAEESPYVNITKLICTKELKKKYSEHPEIVEKISEGADDNFQVFNATTAKYEQTEGKTSVRERYYKPCRKYPKGFFKIFTPTVELHEGELPGGIFPIVFKECEENQTQPRGVSIVRTIRPYQSQINYASSAQLRHILTVGDDKVYVQKGTSVQKGSSMAGIREYKFSGMPPTISKGSGGEQHANFRESVVKELYRVVDLEELGQDKRQSGDVNQEFYKNMKQKQRFSFYSTKFEEFLIEVTKTFLETAKVYYNEKHLVPAIGRSEVINIQEFKSTTPLCTQIKIEGVDDDIDTAFGRSLALNHTLQYVGNQLEKEDIGKMLSAHPFLNKEEILGDFKLDHDNVTNTILALDRGEWVDPHNSDTHDYIIKKLVSRTRKADFKLLPPQIQQNYQQKIMLHQEAEMKRLQEIKAAQSDFIPTGGYMSRCDFYVQYDPNDPSKTRRLSVPSESLSWLVKRLEHQGSQLEVMEKMHESTQQEIAQQMLTQQVPQQSHQQMNGMQEQEMLQQPFVPNEMEGLN